MIDLEAATIQRRSNLVIDFLLEDRSNTKIKKNNVYTIENDQ
jgi:hypothetical protein